MKLNESNSKFAVVKTAFHGGGVISFHNSLAEAIKSDRKYASGGCICGCCCIIPITEEARKDLFEQGYCSRHADLLKDIPCYSGDEFNPYAICK